MSNKEEKKLVLEQKFNYYLYNPYDLKDYVNNSDEREIIAFYRYIVSQKKAFLNTETKEEKIYTTLEELLKNHDAIQKYLAGEISDEKVDSYCQKYEDVLDDIGKVIEKKQNKTTAEKIRNYIHR